MRRKGLLIAIGLLVLVNAVVLGGVAYNRSGAADAEMTLTDRELPLARGYVSRENSGVSLRFSTDHYLYLIRSDLKGSDEFSDPFAWLDRKKLETIGFRFDKLDAQDIKEYRYEKLLPRKTFAVLEFNGPAWEKWKAKLEQKLATMTTNTTDVSRSTVERELRTGSRLFIIDAGNSPDALRAQYPDRSRHLILPAVARVSWYGSNPARNSNKPDIHGHLELPIDEINVPHRFHGRLGRLPVVKKPVLADPFDYAEPQEVSKSNARYEVALRTGKRHEPWIADIVSK